MISYFDAHCDTIHRCLTENIPLRRNCAQVDLRRDAQFARRGQFFALFFDSAGHTSEEMWTRCGQLHGRFLQEMAANPDLVRHCRTGAEVDKAAAEGKTAALLSIEAADLLGCAEERIEEVASWGVKLMNLTWNRRNILSGTNKEEPERGLSDRGRAFVRELERCGVYADVSHLSDPGFWDLAEMAGRPIVASHSNLRSVCPHRRNLTEEQFMAIRDLGGVVGLNFCPPFVDSRAPSLEALVRHVDRMMELGGEKTVCIGGDLDGCDPDAVGIRGEEDVPLLYGALARRGYSEALLADLFWNNLRGIL